MDEKSINKVFSKNLRHYLYINNMTQVELSNLLGVGTTSVYNWCNGIKIPRMGKVDKMCEIFNINRSDLIEDKPTPPTTIAAHLDTEDLTENELKDVEDYIAFIKSKRKN